VGASSVVLAYAVGEERTHLFVLGPGEDELTVAALATAEGALAAEGEALRSALARPSPRRSTWWVPAHRLGERLLAPATGQLARAERILVLPDGPLHFLPFAALPVPGSVGDLLVEVAPLHVAPSVTVVGQLAGRASRAREPRLAAFADPLLPETAARTVRLADAGTRGLDLGPLPASRDEVGELARIFPAGAAVFVGASASEARAKELGTDVTHVHFACHAFADPRSPLDSALALASSPAGEVVADAAEDGLLEAWEVLSQLRLDAELVTLSACETGLGEVAGGEGVLGLARAFQLAGARRVLATQWTIDDRSTRRLMASFYRRLRDGAPTAEALRRAQLELLADPATAHPHHWAAFQLLGDWR
jgi:CHAT domain-containing protein